MTEGRNNEISPDRLFQASYWLEGTAAEPEERLEPSRHNSMRTSGLIMQTSMVGTVTDCGTRQFGWADTQSAISILASWLYLSNPFTAVGTAEEREKQLDHGRLRQFAKTIIGGACRRDGSYQEADENALGPLEDWLRRSLMLGQRRSPAIEASPGI